MKLKPQVLADLRLWLSFLCLTIKGVVLNLVSFRAPTHVFRSDAAEHGIGGFCARSGHAWSIELPSDCRVGCRECISLNLLEFLGSIVAIWVELLVAQVPPGSCLLAQGDSTSATGWLRKSNFPDHSHPLQLEAARHLSFLLLDAGGILYSQWFAGSTNGVSDTLSRDTHLGAKSLTTLCSLYIPLQAPPNFVICPLPPVIVSWVISLLRSQPLVKVSKKDPIRSTLWHGHVGASGCTVSSSCLLYTSPSPRDLSTSRMPSSA